MSGSKPDSSWTSSTEPDTTGNPFQAGSTLDRILKNLGRLLTGRAISSIALLLSTLMMARALAPEHFGQVILVHTYALVWNGLFNCKPFEAIIRYGVPIVERRDLPALARLVRIGLSVDVVSSVAATICAVLVATPVGLILGWSDELTRMAMLYSLILMTEVNGTSKGVLRLFDRFDILSRQLTVGPVLRCLGVGIAWQTDQPIAAFIAAFAAATLVENIYLTHCGWREYRRQGGAPLGYNAPTDWRSEFTGIQRFIAVVYWQSNLDLLPKHVSTLLVGVLLGPAAAGLFRLAREFSALLATPAVLLRQVLFPDLSRLWHRADTQFSQILVRVTTIAALCGLSVVALAAVGSADLLSRLAGEAYRDAAPVLTWLLLAATLDICTSALRAGGYAIGIASSLLRLNIWSSLIYLPVFVMATHWWGLTGPGVAACTAAALSLLGSIALVRRHTAH